MSMRQPRVKGGRLNIMRRLEREAIDLTQRCLQEFWQQDASFVISCLAEDVVWIGAQKDEFLVGREAAENDLREAIKQVPPCVILNGEFYALGSGSRFCTVTARYLTSTAPSAEYFLQGQRRCTFVWEKTKEGMKIRHIHVSNPMGELQLAEGEFVPTTMGKLASGYLQNEIKRLSDRRRLNVIGENGSLQSIALADIMYVMAKGKDTHLVCEDRNFLIKMSITELAEIAGEQDKKLLIPVHRSYLVNPDYISSIERYTLTLLNGTKIPIPVRKYNEVREVLLHFYEGAEA